MEPHTMKSPKTLFIPVVLFAITIMALRANGAVIVQEGDDSAAMVALKNFMHSTAPARGQARPHGLLASIKGDVLVAEGDDSAAMAALRNFMHSTAPARGQARPHSLLASIKGDVIETEGQFDGTHSAFFNFFNSFAPSRGFGRPVTHLIGRNTIIRRSRKMEENNSEKPQTEKPTKNA